MFAEPMPVLLVAPLAVQGLEQGPGWSRSGPSSGVFVHGGSVEATPPVVNHKSWRILTLRLGDSQGPRLAAPSWLHLLSNDSCRWSLGELVSEWVAPFLAAPFSLLCAFLNGGTWGLRVFDRGWVLTGDARLGLWLWLLGGDRT